jgi:DNA-binding transcriptional ArsR family regulator
MSAHAKCKSSFDQLINKSADIFQALSHPLRLAMCLELFEAERSVSQLCDSLDQPQHSISQHLALLRKQQLVTARKVSRQVFYSIEDSQVRDILMGVTASLGTASLGTASLGNGGTAGGNANQAAVASEAGKFSTVFRPSVKLWSGHERVG